MKKLIITLSIFLVNCQNDPIVLIENPMENVKIKRTYRQLENDEKELINETFYDDFGNVIKEIEYEDSYRNKHPKPTVSAYVFDKKGEKLIEKKHYELGEKPYYHIKYTYQYNDKNQLIEEIEHDILDTKKHYEYYTYNDLGLKDTNRSAYFDEGQIHTFSSFNTYEYDQNHHLKIKTFHTNNEDIFEKQYKHDENGNLLKYEVTKGTFLCGDDIAKEVYTYNKRNQLLLEETWNAMGENWGFEYVYKNGLLFSKTDLYRFPIEKEVIIRDEKDLENPSLLVPPPPPNYTRNDLEKEYTKTDVTYYYYNDKQQVIKSIRKVLNEKGIKDKVYLFEYE